MFERLSEAKASSTSLDRPGEGGKENPQAERVKDPDPERKDDSQDQAQDTKVNGGETTFEEGQTEQEEKIATGTGDDTDTNDTSSESNSSKQLSLNPFQRWRRGSSEAATREEDSLPATEIEQVEGREEEEEIAHDQSAGEDSKEASESKIEGQKADSEGVALGAGAGGRTFLRPFQRWRASPAENDASKPLVDDVEKGDYTSSASSDIKEKKKDGPDAAVEEIPSNTPEQTVSEDAEKNNASEMEPAMAETAAEGLQSLDVKSTSSGFSLNPFRRNWRGNTVKSEEATGDASEKENLECPGEEKDIVMASEPVSPPQATKEEGASNENSTTLADKMRKGAVAVAGGTITVVGLIMIPLPTPMGCVVAASGLSLLSTEFEGAKKVQQSCSDTLVSTRDTLIDTVERTIEDDGEDDEKDPDAICHTEEESGIVIEVNADGYFDDDDDDNDFYYQEDTCTETKKKRVQQLQEQQKKANALQNYKKQLGLQTRAYLATSVLPMLHKTKEFGSNATSTNDALGNNAASSSSSER